jgi:hypothetical protein
MGQLFWQIGIAGMMAVAALFILSIFDIALLEEQCGEYCGECYSNINILKLAVECKENASQGCLKGCEKRGVSCDFDPVYRKWCENCTEGCSRYPAGSGGYENCTQACFSWGK